MSVRILIGDVREQLRQLEPESVDCVITSPPYWGLRDYGVEGQIGMEHSLGEHIEILVSVFDEVRRVMKPKAALWINYGDCYATAPNGRSAADTKAAGNDDRTFRDKPFSTVGPIYDPNHRARGARGNNLAHHAQHEASLGRVVAGGYLKPKDLCLTPFRLAIALQEAGWWVRSRCIWGKPNAMPDSSGRWRPAVAHEEIFLLSKSGDLYYDSEAVKKPSDEERRPQVAGWAKEGPHTPVAHNKPDKQRGHSRRHQGFNDRWDGMSREEQQENGRLLRTYEPEVWHMATQAFSGAHFATFPTALVERCLTASCPKNGVILDPFGGSGTVGLVAEGMGFDSILIELNPEYAAIADDRIRGALGRVEGKPLGKKIEPPLFASLAS